jgi:Acetyl-CoA hydrolase/transferase N-terminal domain
MGALASVDGIDLRMPYQSDPVSRAKINSGVIDYLDVHLSHVAQMVWEGFSGHLDVALVEVAGITADGELISSSSVGNNKTWIDLADRVILEVNSRQPAGLEGMHDIYYGTALPPHRRPVPIVHPADRIGVPYLHCPHDKIAAVVPTHAPDRNTPFKQGGSPNRAWPTCAARRHGGVPSTSSTPAPTPATGPRCRTTSTARWLAHPGGTPPTCWRKPWRGTSATCGRAPCTATNDAPRPTESLADPPCGRATDAG